jgi:hypothetical protein
MIHLDNEHIHRIHPIEPVGPEFIFMHFSGNLSASPKCWLWSLIIFLIQRSFLSTIFIPHEDFTHQKNVHSSMWGSAEGGYPLCGVHGQAGPRRKNFLLNVNCNFIVNMDRSL